VSSSSSSFSSSSSISSSTIIIPVRVSCVKRGINGHGIPAFVVKSPVWGAARGGEATKVSARNRADRLFFVTVKPPLLLEMNREAHTHTHTRMDVCARKQARAGLCVSCLSERSHREYLGRFDFDASLPRVSVTER